ncbi:protein kinase [Nannocystis sp. SCPEA4]|uniref:protein kinase domain-containing protein n=1 Tax=Nannocystis sp. SCPEA4 TaxID=2996787 RepID=UPI0022711464|nr:protein kinase [Nannocystis sp. SCPEA4]
MRFAREARALQAVRHPALPELFDCRTAMTRKRPYIAMSLMRGKSARSLYMSGALKPEQVIAVGRQLAGALAELHAHGIVHRDVHGSNVLIDLEGEPTAALIDCGMVEFEARFYATVEQRYPTPPEARVKLGTGGLERLDWTAPEARAGKGWTVKSDVYSLGLLLYQLVTGRRPVRDDRGEWVSPRKHVPSCPLALATALLNTLEDEPAARVDMRGLLEKLEAAADELAEETCEDEDEALGPSPPASRAAAPGGVAAPEPPSVAAPAAVDRSGGRAALVGALGVLLGGLVVWLVLRESPAPQRPEPLGGVKVEPTEASPPRLPTAPPVTESSAQGPSSTPPPASLPTMPEALGKAATDLRRCSELAGGLLLVEFETAAGRSEFVRVLTHSSDDKIRGCVDAAVHPIRFLPTDAQTFTEEYMP